VAIASAWQEIRALRAAPPGLAADDDDRRATFDAALRQAQELAEASAAAGYAAKPVPLFYALSQAGRAIAASRLNGDWRLRGHGLAAADQTKGVLGSTVKPNGGQNTSFAAVGRAIASPPLAGCCELGALWVGNPDLTGIEIPAGHAVWPPALRISLGTRSMRTPTGEIQDPRVMVIHTGGLVGVAVPVPGTLVADVAAALGSYPTLRDAKPYSQGPTGIIGPGQPDDVAARGTDMAGVSAVTVGRPIGAEITMQEWNEAQEAFCSVFEPTRPFPAETIGYALPALAGGDSPHMLMLWWALLLGLSSFARYEPAAWTAAIDPSSSVLAVSLERVLDIAEDKVPSRILDALQAGERLPTSERQ
jgi:hypothetical protein